MRKRPTPQTDAVAAYEGNWDTKALRMTAHSRKLERERDEAREEIRDWKRLHDAAERGVDLTIAEGTISDLLKQRDEARRELKFLWRERDDAREKAERYRLEANSLMLQRDELRYKYDTLATEHMLVVNKLCEERDEALEKVKELIYIADRAIALADIDFENDKFGVVSELRSDLEEIKKSK